MPPDDAPPSVDNKGLGSFSVSAWLYLALVGFAIAAAVFGWPPFQAAAILLTVCFMGLEIRRVPRPQLIMGAVLIGGGLAFGGLQRGVVEVLVEGLGRAQIFLVLFFAVAWLQVPAAASPTLRAVRQTVVSQPPGRRFLYLAGGVHMLGSVLNLAGLSLLSTMVQNQSDPALRRRMATALMQGFTSASCWSPFYVSVVVVMTAIPEVRWSDLAVGGAPLAAAMIACAWAYDRVVHRPRLSTPALPPAPAATPLPLVAGVRLALILGSLMALVVGLVEVARVSLPVALALIAPPFSWAWMAIVAGPTPARAGRHIAGAVMARLPNLRNEALAFIAASLFGIGVASAVPGAAVAEALAAAALPGEVIVFLVTAGIVVFGAVGLHPVIPVILVGEILTPEMLGLPAPVMGLALLGVWGLSTLVSPFSATTLFMSRVLSVPAHTIAWRWNPPYVVLATLVVFLSISLVWRMQLF